MIIYIQNHCNLYYPFFMASCDSLCGTINEPSLQTSRCLPTKRAMRVTLDVKEWYLLQKEAFLLSHKEVAAFQHKRSERSLFHINGWNVVGSHKLTVFLIIIVVVLNGSWQIWGIRGFNNSFQVGYNTLIFYNADGLNSNKNRNISTRHSVCW